MRPARAAVDRSVKGQSGHAAAVHPHVSHRRYVYQFPIGLPELDTAGQADWALLDVTTNTDMAPGDIKGAVDRLLAGKWGVVDGADGFLLLRRGATAKVIPGAFYDFARGTQVGDGAAQENPLLFTGAQTDEWPRWRQTRVVACWQVGSTFHAAPVAPQLEIMTPAGDLLYAFSMAAPPALLWYQPEQWQPGEVVCVKTLPLYLPQVWGLHVAPAGQDALAGTSAPYAQSLLRSTEGATLTQLFERITGGAVAQIPSTAANYAQEGARTQYLMAQGEFLVEGKPLRIILSSPPQIAPGAELYLRLVWGGDTFSDWPANLAAFVHLRRGDTTIAQVDGPPRFFRLGHTQNTETAPSLLIEEWRQIELPPTVVPGEPLTVVVGLYVPATGERLELQQATAPAADHELHVGPITVDVAPIPDQTCALIPATCASQVEP